MNDAESRISITADIFHVSRGADIRVSVVDSSEYTEFIQSEQLRNPIMYQVELLDSDIYSRNMLKYRYIVPVPDSIDPEHIVVYGYQNLHFVQVKATVYKAGERKNDYGYDVIVFEWFEIGPFIIAEKP